jgi:hypothetical protein
MKELTTAVLDCCRLSYGLMLDADIPCRFGGMHWAYAPQHPLVTGLSRHRRISQQDPEMT